MTINRKDVVPWPAQGSRMGFTALEVYSKVKYGDSRPKTSTGSLRKSNTSPCTT